MKKISKFFSLREITRRVIKFLLIFLVIAGWIFSGWPQIFSRAQTATSTPSDQTATSTIGESTLEEEVSNPAPEPPQPQAPPLKERKLNKEVRIDKNASHKCQAKNFTVDISNKNSAIVDLDLKSKRDSLENLEIGSLPLGIDITFLNNASYEYAPSKNESATVLQIANQPGSQKGNFSVPIIYTRGNSTTICQINIINL